MFLMLSDVQCRISLIHYVLFDSLGRLFINATSGTHVYFDKKTRAGGVRFYEYVCGY